MQSFAAENTTITAEAEAGAGETQNGTIGETKEQPATEQQDPEVRRRAAVRRYNCNRWQHNK